MASRRLLRRCCCLLANSAFSSWRVMRSPSRRIRPAQLAGNSCCRWCVLRGAALAECQAVGGVGSLIAAQMHRVFQQIGSCYTFCEQYQVHADLLVRVPCEIYMSWHIISAAQLKVSVGLGGNKIRLSSFSRLTLRPCLGLRVCVGCWAMRAISVLTRPECRLAC